MSRTGPGLLLAAAWLLLLLKGSFLLFWVVGVLIGLIGGREFVRMVFNNMLFETDRVILSVIICIPMLATLYASQNMFSVSFGVLLAFVALTCFTMYHYTRFENPLSILTRGVLGIVLIGVFGSHLVMIRSLPDGAHWLVILSAITAGSDSFAYWTGSRWGRRKLCPNISPNKTVEGAVGGIIGGMFAALVLSLFLEVQASTFIILILAFFLSIIGMLGDLLESVIKRGTDTKDSGKILGGHGGVLDRVDSLLMTAPFLYCTLICMGI